MGKLFAKRSDTMAETLVLEPLPEPLTESTTEPIRKLASVRKISEINPIPGADMIVMAVVDGWQLVTQKSNNFKPDDLVVFFEIDSFLPVEERFEFLRKSSFKTTKHLGDGFRIKTIKLRGQVSQGLILPLDAFPELFDTSGNPPSYNTHDEESGITFDVLLPVNEGDDLTERLRVKKWEKPISPQLAGVARGNFPPFIRKTDQERVQNIFGKLKGRRRQYNHETGEVTELEEFNFDQQSPWESTLKLDGSSCTIYLKGDVFGVCSRNLDLKETEGNTFWEVARYLELEKQLREFGKNLAFQGELMGPGVQGNREAFETHHFFLFDIWDIDEARYLTPKERFTLYTQHFDVEHVPILPTVTLGDFKSVDDFLAFADRPSVKHKTAEGVVFKSWDGKDSFKIINNKFLLAEKD